MKIVNELYIKYPNLSKEILKQFVNISYKRVIDEIEYDLCGEYNKDNKSKDNLNEYIKIFIQKNNEIILFVVKDYIIDVIEHNNSNNLEEYLDKLKKNKDEWIPEYMCPIYELY